MLSLLVFLAVVAALLVSTTEAAKVVCYYDGTSYHREGVAKTKNITEVAFLCDQLIYGYYKVNSDYEIQTSFNYPYKKGENAGSELKRINPSLKVLLSVGGPVSNKKTDRCLKLMESPKKRAKFVSAVDKTMREYGYDGVDLGWQWPESFKPEDKEFMDDGILKGLKDFWGNIKSQLRESPSFYRENFQVMVRELKAVIKPTGKMLSISSLPHIDAAAYYDFASLKDLVDQVVLHTYDYRSPVYYPTLADHAAPLHFKNATNRRPDYNVEATVAQWLSAGVPSEKLIVVIPTFGHSWEVDDTVHQLIMKHHTDPPYRAKEIGSKGTYTQINGLVSYYEICPHLVNYVPSAPTANAGGTLLNRVPDPDRRLGTYCFRAPGLEKGVWISFEEPETAAVKAAFVKSRRLGGAAVMDLSLDDFRGMCGGTAFPILKAVRQNVI